MKGAIFASLVVAAAASHTQAAPQYPYQRCFEVAARMHEVPLDLVLAVAATESNWQADARSHADAHGIMQIQWPGTARHLGARRVAELYNPCLNIALGARYLAELLAQFPSEEAALAAYNYGPTRIREADAIPDGARAYAQTVMKHRARIVAGSLPQTLRRGTRQTLATFDSRTRARRVARILEEDLEGATVTVERRSRLRGGHAVVLNVGAAGLTMSDHATLAAMGLVP